MPSPKKRTPRWTGAEKLRVVLAAEGLEDEALGALAFTQLRRVSDGVFVKASLFLQRNSAQWRVHERHSIT